METSGTSFSTNYTKKGTSPGGNARNLIQISLNTFLEYSGVCLGIIGTLGVRMEVSPGARELGFMLWFIGGLVLIAWGYHTNAKAIMVINALNIVMALSALVTLV